MTAAPESTSSRDELERRATAVLDDLFTMRQDAERKRWEFVHRTFAHKTTDDRDIAGKLKAKETAAIDLHRLTYVFLARELTRGKLGIVEESMLLDRMKWCEAELAEARAKTK